MRKGRQYLDALDDDRSIYLSGRRVAKIVNHPAFRGICHSIAALYDFAADPANHMVVEQDGIEMNKVYMIPRSREQLQDRRHAIALWSKLTHGFVGRGPDHVAGFLAGFASRPEVFSRAEPRFGTNVADFYRKLVAESLHVAYVIIPPQVDRSRTAKDWDTRFIQAGVVRDSDAGIIVRGAQMLGTAASVADYLFVSCIVPLKPGDEDYALSFVVPLGARGLKLYCRRPYAPASPSAFDYPLSTRFDESDALVVFDDVLVPWENVFVYRNVELIRAQFFETAAHVLGNTQAQIRLVQKLKFLLGLARKITATTRVDQIPTVQEKLGELASLASIVEGMVLAAEATCVVRDGVAWPNPRFLYGAMGLQAELYPRVLHLVRELAGGGLLQVPDTAEELTSPETATDMERYLGSPGINAVERVKLFKAAWDAVGSEFGSRHHQYEMFYAGAPHVARGYAYRAYGYEETLQIVESFLDSYAAEQDVGAMGRGTGAQI